MNREFVPSEQALDLKELGFDEECFGYCDNFNIFIIDRNSKIEHKNSIYSNNELYKGVVLMPLYQQCFRWLSLQLNKEISLTCKQEEDIVVLKELIDELRNIQNNKS